MSLTSSDGRGLELVRLSGRAVVQDPLAFTELKLVFENPEDRTLEGTFSITLPQGATVSRFAMKLGARWQEGEVIERQAARAVYEDFLHRRQDPALLEQSAGSSFTARVFPIPARGRKELILSYSQELAAAEPYALPLRGLPRLGEIDAAVSLFGAEAPAVALQERDFEPDSDFILAADRIPRGAGLRNGNLAVMRVRPLPDPSPDPLASTLVLIDTSASRVLGFEEEVRLAEKIIRRVAEAAGPSTPLSVGCYDQTVEAVFDGAAGSFGERDIGRILERQALGASNLEGALDWAFERARMRGLRRVILMTDGVATAGATETGKLRAAAAKLKLAGVERLDALAMGGIRDDALLRQLVTAGLARTGVVADAALGAEAIERRLTEATRSAVAINVEGARWWWPRTADGLQAGDEVRVFADVPDEKPIKVSVDGAAASVLALPGASTPLLRRAWAQAKIASLLNSEGASGASAETQRAIVALSTENRVLSPYTALLVLETEDDYARFKIDRRALGDILTIEQGRIAVAKRGSEDGPALSQGAAPGSPDAAADGDIAAAANQAQEVAPPGPLPSWPAASPSASAAAAGSGTPAGDGAGTGTAQGNGSAHGRIATRHAARMPMMRMGQTTVSGRLPPEVIRHIVHLNFGRFRHCYENGLRTSPKLAGRVVVRFVIDENGSVEGASSEGSDLPNASVVACVVRAFNELSFPSTNTGSITVIYPLAFAPAGAAEEAAPESSEQAQRHELPAPRVRTNYIPEARTHEGDAPKVEPYTGRFKGVMDAIAGTGGPKVALELASAWHKEEPGDVMSLVALGEALEATGDAVNAARAYGSLIDLFPARADMRRFAGERLDRVRGGAGLELAVDTYRRAAADRPDHPAGHRLLAIALLKTGAFEEAFKAVTVGLRRSYPIDRFGGVVQILKEDLGLIAAAWIKAEPARQGEILERLNAAGSALEDEPSLRFVLTWETDANDVDFHIYDASDGHAYFGNKRLGSGGELYSDITTGYGPECFTVRTSPRNRPAHYKLQAHYYSRGPMGYGMGKLEIIDHDGSGGLKFDERPFVVMSDRAFVDLGTVKGTGVVERPGQ